ncbi:MAG: ArsA family ATPase [Myxococcaceae bacterium]
MNDLLRQRLWIVSGKGGVGKTTLSAALALAAHQQGRRTLVCQVGAEERIAPLLGHPRCGPVLKEIEPNLWAVAITPEEALHEYGLMVLRFERVSKAVFENKLVQQFVRFLPSLAELMMLGKVLFHVREKSDSQAWRFDTIVLDAPATGHAVSFLGVPQALLDTVPKGPLFDQAQTMRNVLVDPKTTAAILATLPEEMPVNEALELHQTLTERLAIRVGGILLNAFEAERFLPEEMAQLSASPELAVPLATQRALQQASRDALERLTPCGVPICTLPRLRQSGLDRASIEALARTLTPWLLGAAP